MDDFEIMALPRRRSERIEPALRRGTAKPRTGTDVVVYEADRPNPRRTRIVRDRGIGVAETGSGGGKGGDSGGGRKGKGRHSRPRRSVFRRLLRGFFIIVAVSFVAVGGAIAYYASQLPSITSLEVPARPPNIAILAADGTTIANRGDTGGANVSLDELPPYLIEAVVAIEDRRFYTHLGVDLVRLGRVVIDAVSGDRPAGASTITQQLARTLFLTMDRTAERKIQEAILAVWLELKYTKDDILEMYLNRVYFGAGAYGIDAAARVYFGKPAADVTLAEAAMLAGVLPRPSAYAPTANPAAAKSRQLLVLQAMVDNGYISREEADLAAASEIVTVDTVATGGGNYVADWVADLVPDFIGVIPGDIVVVTTIDPRLQEEAGQTIRNGLEENGEALGVTQGALVAMSPDGAVRAMVGGRDYNASQFNRAVTAKRQPGSAFKPFVYLTALERGMTPQTVRFDQPVNIDGWTPGNYTGEYLGPVSLQQGLALSLNTISAQLTAEVGPAAVVATARRLGIGSQIEPNMSIALGTSEVSVLEMTGAYATFANGGSGVIPYVIQRIQTEDGEVLYERMGGGPGQVIRPQHVAMMNGMMTETLETGTGRRAAIAGWQAAGKTGTSQEWRDAWFVGYTSHLVAALWLGNDDNTPTARSTGGNLPATMWSGFMTVAHEGVIPAGLPNGPSSMIPVAAQNITDVINQNGAPPNLMPGAEALPANAVGAGGGYDAYAPQYEGATPPQYNGAYAPQYNEALPPQYNGAYAPQYNDALPPQYNEAYPPQYGPDGKPVQPASGGPVPPAPVNGPAPAYMPQNPLPPAPGSLLPQPQQEGLFGGFFRRLLGGN
jgi:penicillin-binding protein 1A